MRSLPPVKHLPYYRLWLLSVLVFCLALCQSQTALAIEQAGKQWETVTLETRFSERFLLYVDLNHRNNGGFGHSNALLIRPAVGYQVTKNLSLWQGYGWTPKLYPYQDQQRIWQQATYNRKLKKLSLSNRLRLEQKFMSGLYHGASVRFRDRLKVSYPLTKNQRLYVVASDEFFYNLNSRHHGPHEGFEQNRAFVGLGHKITNNTAVEAGYLMQYLSNANEAESINHVLQVGVKIKR